VPRTLLLADDSLTIQRVIKLTFADQGIQVVAVGDGDQAIGRMDAQPPDIVLADVTMPGKSGYEVASYVKHSPQLSHIPVLLLAGAFEPVDQARVSESRCDGVLVKPLEPQSVVVRVKELLGSDPDEPAPPMQAVVKPQEPPVAAETTSVSPRLVSRPEREDEDSQLFADSLDDFLDQVDAAIANLPKTRRADQGVSSNSALSRALAESQTLPELAEAFAALVVAAPSDAIGLQPEMVSFASVSSTLATQSDAQISDELVDRIAARVLERISDRTLRETVMDLVSSTAERLVRDEIERIKGSIK
jgi:CheY-like chemotaxis protein